MFTAPTATVWTGNLMWPTGSAMLGVSATDAQIRIADPLVVGTGDQPWLLTASSPAVDAASGSAVTLDVQGQTRSQPDIGADEYAPGSTVRFAPLTAADVGPEAFEGAVSTAPRSSPPDPLALFAYPNPFRQQVEIALTVPAAGAVRVAVFDALGRRVAVLWDGPLTAGVHPLALDGAGLAPGVYLVRASSATGAASRSVTLVR